jgi:hypothetical protein
MMNVFRRITICGALLSSVLYASAAMAQTTPETPFGKFLDQFDLGLNVIGVINPDSSGTSLTPQAVSQVPSNTAGGLGELRYTRSPLIGVTINFTQARFTENYTVTDIPTTPKAQLPYVLGVQATENEFSLGYFAHAPNVFGLHPFAGAGVGAVEFKPTAGGGQSLPKQVRAGFYYTVGVDQPLFSPNFGVRVQFRQLFLGAPDFNQNYLATGARIVSTEPGFGFYLRF